MGSAAKLRQALAQVAAAAMSAVLLWFGTGLEPQWPLLWVAPLPMLLVVLHTSAVRSFVLAACAWLLGSMNMWHYFHGVLHAPYVVLAAGLAGPAVVFGLAALLFRAMVRRTLYWFALLSFPAAWVSMEYISSIVSIHGTAFSVAYSQLKCLPLLQLASITGPWGISYVVMLFSSSIALGLYLWRKERSQSLQVLSAGLAAIGLVLAFGIARLWLPASGPTVRVGLIASDAHDNIAVADDGAPTDRLLRDYTREAELLAARGAQIIVLPEKLGVLVEPDSGSTDSVLQGLADKDHLSVVAGLIAVDPPLKFNQARLYSPGALPLTYDKHHLLPPFESKLRPGTSLTVLSHQSSMWGIAICKDMDFTPLSRKYGAAGVGLMLVPAWDFNLDRIWHGHIALMRGVENGFGMVRAAKQGFLTVSDNRGRVIAESRSDANHFASLIADVPVGHARTFYILAGDWFAWVALAMLFASLLQVRRILKTSAKR